MKFSVKQKLALAAAATVIALGCSNLAQGRNAVMVRPQESDDLLCSTATAATAGAK